MKLLPRSFHALPRGGVALVGLLFVALSQAVAQDRPVVAATASTAAAKPQVPAERDAPSGTSKKQAGKAAGRAVAPAGESAKTSQKETTLQDEAAAQKALEIAALQRELKAKQERAELLMHLFVADERQFIISPTNPIDDPATKARIRAEQEELRAESAACARLKARLDELTTASQQN